MAARSPHLEQQKQPPPLRGQPGWYDVTATMDAASASLPGALLHAPDFSLYEAMGAVELGDESPLEEKQEQPLSPLQQVGDECVTEAVVCAVADGMLVREVAWLSGHTLAQTVLTCRSLTSLPPSDDSQSQQQQTSAADSSSAGNASAAAALDALVRGQRASVARVLEIVAAADIAEEEDFVGIRYGFSEEDSSECSSSGSSVVDALDAATAGLARARVGTEDGSRGRSQDDDAMAAARAALVRRLRLRAALVKALSRIAELPRCGTLGEKRKEAYAEEDEEHQLVLEIRVALTDAVAAMREIISVADARHSGTAKSSNDDAAVARGAASFFVGAEHSRRLLGPSPVRRCELPNVVEAMHGMRDTLSAMLRACDVAECASLDNVHEFVLELCECDVGILPRSLLWLLIRRGGGKWLRRQIARALGGVGNGMSGDDTSHTTTAAVGKHAEINDADCASGSDDGELLSTSVVDASYEHTLLLLRAYCGNPGRRRRALRHCLTAWAGMYAVAGDSQRALEWVRESVIRQQVALLQFGFALELYAEHEYTMVYWYLGHLISMLLARTSGQASQNGRDGDATTTMTAHECRRRARETALWSTKASLCQGAVRLLAGLRVALRNAHCVGEGVEQRRNRNEDAFNSEAERFRQRFGCFVALPHPRAVTYAEYAAATDASARSPAELYRTALPFFVHARTTAATLKEANGDEGEPDDESCRLERIATANRIAAQVLLGQSCAASDGDEASSGSDSASVPMMDVHLERAPSALFFTVRCCVASSRKRTTLPTV